MVETCCDSVVDVVECLVLNPCCVVMFGMFDILGSCGVFLLVKFLCVILLRMGCGRNLSVLRILPTSMCFCLLCKVC